MTIARLSSQAQGFVNSVLELSPKVAVFDCDGTLWSGDSGADFFYWQIRRNMLPPQVAQWALERYADYKRGNVGEETMCGEMVTISAGLSERELEVAAREFFDCVVKPRIFPEMLDLATLLQSSGCELWAVSSTNVWVVAEGAKRFGIPPQRVLAACARAEEGRVTQDLVRVPSGPAKAFALGEVLGKQIDVCFGNSIHDLAMMETAAHAFAVNPNADLEQIAREREWRIYWPMGAREFTGAGK
ncbi:MAG TPA: haloacid dehalogenase-like hydrolase [Terriglobales bacterium]|nr:haloacid dehalogenase-like hydrolase [Terriglobales bacterium]